MSHIHPTAIVDQQAEIAADVEIGPYVVIKGRVQIGAGCVIDSHSVIHGHAVLGKGCRIGPGAYLGMAPQHRNNAGEGTSCLIGDGAVIREGATVDRSTRPGEEFATRLGNRCYLMANAHVGHDCRVGDDVTLANATLLAGHVTVGDGVFFGGGSGVHQFCRIGRLAILGGMEVVRRDVPPFASVRYGGLKAYNAVGCRRFGFDAESIRAIRAAYHCLHSHRTLSDAIAAIWATVANLPVREEIIAFATEKGRGILPSVRFLKGAEAGDAAESALADA